MSARMYGVFILFLMSAYAIASILRTFRLKSSFRPQFYELFQFKCVFDDEMSDLVVFLVNSPGGYIWLYAGRCRAVPGGWTLCLYAGRCRECAHFGCV